MEGSVF